MPSTHIALTYHLIFSTKHREPWLTGDRLFRTHAMLGGCIRTQGGVALEIGGVADHVHLMVGLKATHCVADFIREIKRATSSWFHDTFRRAAFAWQEGYGAFTVSAGDCNGLVQYIRTQEEHHRTHTFQEEYLELLQRHQVQFDEQYLW